MTSFKGFLPNTVSQSETEDWLSFTLLKEGLFDEFDYKKLNKNLSKGFAECRHSVFNGKDKLSYKIKGLTALSEALGDISDADFLKLMRSLFGTLSGFDSIGHLEKSNIIYDPNYIFADENFNAELIYLPVKKQVQKGEAVGLKELYSRLKHYKDAYKNLSTERTAKLFRALAENKPSEEILKIAEAELIIADLDTKGGSDTKTGSDPAKAKSKFVLSGIGVAHKLKFEFEEEGEYLIGRSPKKADLVTPGDFKMISNLHCKITGTGEGWLLEDLNSTNGTKINGSKTAAFTPAKLCEGDKIALADVEFIWKKAKG